MYLVDVMGHVYLRNRKPSRNTPSAKEREHVGSHCRLASKALFPERRIEAVVNFYLPWTLVLDLRDGCAAVPIITQVESSMWAKRFSFDRCFGCDEDGTGGGQQEQVRANQTFSAAYQHQTATNSMSS